MNEELSLGRKDNGRHQFFMFVDSFPMGSLNTAQLCLVFTLPRCDSHTINTHTRTQQLRGFTFPKSHDCQLA